MVGAAADALKKTSLPLVPSIGYYAKLGGSTSVMHCYQFVSVNGLPVKPLWTLLQKDIMVPAAMTTGTLK